MNKVVLIGRLGKDPDLRHTNSGKAVCNLTVATSDSWVTKDGQKQEKTEWHQVAVWGKLAEIANEYCFKGCQIVVEGKITTEQYEKNGQKMYSTKIMATVVRNLSPSNKTAPTPDEQNQEISQEELPSW